MIRFRSLRSLTGYLGNRGLGRIDPNVDPDDICNLVDGAGADLTEPDAAGWRRPGTANDGSPAATAHVVSHTMNSSTLSVTQLTGYG